MNGLEDKGRLVDYNHGQLLVMCFDICVGLPAVINIVALLWACTSCSLCVCK
jgi:hypothetical protein